MTNIMFVRLMSFNFNAIIISNKNNVSIENLNEIDGIHGNVTKSLACF